MQFELRQYQKEGIEIIKQKKNFGIFWQQRLGKTIVAIKSIEEYQKVIFAVPNNTIFHWYNEIKNNIAINDLRILPKSKAARYKLYQDFNNSEKKMWLIASYDTLAQDFYHNNELLNNFNYLILDEAHFLRNNKTMRAKGINKLRLKSNYALALSGTPAVNSPIDILRILKFLYPESNYSHKYIYKKKYFHPVKIDGTRKINWEIRPEMVNEWKKFLDSMCDIKKVYDYLKWLPKTIEKNVVLEMDIDQRKHYNRMLVESKRILLNSKYKEKYEANAMTQIIRLQQICLDPKILNIQAQSIKIQWLENFLNELLNEDENEYVIVFTNFTSLFRNWNINIDKKFNYAYLTGQQTDKEKQQIINDFQNKKIKVLFANIKVASLGLTLDQATCTIFLDKSWNPVNNEQASFRMIDTKQKEFHKPKLNINVICSNSIDDKINDVLNSKRTKTSIIYELEKYLLEN